NLYNNITYMYPHKVKYGSHSLGGAVSSLISATFGTPVIAFKTPAEKLAVTQLHLLIPPSTQHITHVIHTADPIVMGTCNGVTLSCALAGYAMETRCHLGQVVLCHAVTKLGWAVDIRTHAVLNVIERLLSDDKKDQGEHKPVRLAVPEAKPEVDCVDCFNWEYGEWD
ncbi:hypothetical protein J3A83DRAFT_4100194, partial [Scleroderma citrinum]